jgi:hypothetical protein
MLEILELYVSSFWAWAGITIGLVIVFAIAQEIVGMLIKKK